MPIYICTKNVKIFKIYQNCRNDVQFSSSLRNRESHFLFFFFVLPTNKYKKPKIYFRFSFICKKVPKNEKRKSTSVFRFSFYLQKVQKNEKRKSTSVFRFICKKIPKKRKSTSFFRFICSPN